MDFDVAASKIERYDAVNNRLLQTLDADPLMVDDPENTLACSLLETIPEFSYDDADLILDVVEQYLRLIDGDEETKRKIIRRYAKNKFGIDAGIRYYGEVLRTAIVRRKNIKEIPLTHANAEELYYRFVIRRWDMLERVIEPKEHGFPCDYTNMFLLQHSEYIPELLIESEEKYRFYAELKRSVKHTEINKDADNIGFEYRDVVI